MAASTVQLQMDRPAIGQFPPNLQYKLKINTKIPAGTWAMRVQGNDFVEPYVAGTANSILLGVAETDYDNLGGLTVKTTLRPDLLAWSGRGSVVSRAVRPMPRANDHQRDVARAPSQQRDTG